MPKPQPGNRKEQQLERRKLPTATLFPGTYPQAPGPSGISAGRLGLAGVEPPQLAEAGEPEFEQHLLLGSQSVRQHAEGFALQHTQVDGQHGQCQADEHQQREQQQEGPAAVYRAAAGLGAQCGR